MRVVRNVSLKWKASFLIALLLLSTVFSCSKFKIMRLKFLLFLMMFQSDKVPNSFIPLPDLPSEWHKQQAMVSRREASKRFHWILINITNHKCHKETSLGDLYHWTPIIHCQILFWKYLTWRSRDRTTLPNRNRILYSVSLSPLHRCHVFGRELNSWPYVNNLFANFSRQNIVSLDYQRFHICRVRIKTTDRTNLLPG